MNKTIKEECQAVVENFTNDILWYLTEYPNKRKEFADNFKQEFCRMVDDYTQSLNENSDDDSYAERYDEPADIDDDCGFDPYDGCFTYDC